MRNLNIYIWGNEKYNIYHFMDYAKNSTDNDVSLFFLNKKPRELSNQKNVYIFDYPAYVTPAWVDVIYAIAGKIEATSVRVHSAISYSETINFPLIKAFHQNVLTGLQLSFHLYEFNFNDIAYRQEFNNLLNKGLHYHEHVKNLNKKVSNDSKEWNAVYNYLLGEIIDVQYFFDDFYINANTTLFSAPYFQYINKSAAMYDSSLIMKVFSLLELKMSLVDLIKEIGEKKKTLFFIDDGVDFPLSEEGKDACLMKEILEQHFEFVFLINYTGNLDSKRHPGVNFIRLPDILTLDLLSVAGVSPKFIYGICSLALFSYTKAAVQKIFFHEHKRFPVNIKLSHFIRSHHSDSIPFIFINETLNLLEKEKTAKHIFSIGESMGDALFAIGSMNELRHELSGAFVLLAPKIYHGLLIMCPYVDAVWAYDELDNKMEEDIYIAKVLGQYHTPCSGTHIFADRHQIDSILENYGRKNVSNARKEIVLSLDNIDKSKVDSFIETNKLAGKVVLIHPNEGVPNRTWPKTSWEKLIELFLNDGWSVVLIGANKNFYAHKKTVEIGNSRVFNAIDRFTMAETVYLMTKSSLLVACDSGPVALAAATDIAICAIYSVVPGRYRLPYRHGFLGWNALAVNLSCQYGHCAKYYLSDTRGTFDAWCPNNKTYSCMTEYNVDDFYREINQFVASKKFVDQRYDCL
ncbi:MAG: glycosyltransferase family 9 protein [Citrobacter sp.]|uniref:Glycosyltransferase family 9 protein n=1 Tax=Citrobacter tructae TaxID=2562449 RepID=A0ABX5T785_9ENTR|nr:glycosyltransferase family 9 protein [Citrobacter tructae]QBX81114.1 hypothetical protein E4Z61_12375 [Citrobacter tructae]